MQSFSTANTQDRHLIVDWFRDRSVIIVFLALLLMLLSGCQSTAKTANPTDIDTLFHDNLFTPVSVIEANDIFQLPPEFVSAVRNQYRTDHIGPKNNRVAHEWLAEFLGAQKGGFEYRDHYTRTASVTALERQGNCMSLVVLTASLADILNVPVAFFEIDVEPVWDKRGGFYLINGHVNLMLSPPDDANTAFVQQKQIQVDFLPERSTRSYSKKRVNKTRLTAMYYNNIAAEALVESDYDLAYALVKQSILIDPSYVTAMNTLAVIYKHSGFTEQAETVYRTVLKIHPEDMTTLFNLALILGEQDRLEEWAEIHKVLELSRINNPFYYFDMAQQAYFDKEYREALVWYKRAVEKADYRHEFYFGLSKAYWATGNEKMAEKHMKKALALTHDQYNKRRYQSKLQAIQHH